MESRRRAELLATLSPEGRATYEVLRAQLARDMDRCFAESKARLEKGVEEVFGDLRPSCSQVPGRDDAERAKEIVAATATAPALSPPAVSHVFPAPVASAPPAMRGDADLTAATPIPADVAASSDITKDDLSPGARRMYDYLVGASTSLEDVHDAVDIGVAALAISAPTSCSAECPSHDASIYAAAPISSATPNSSTTTDGVALELAAPQVSDKALDVDVTGDTAPMTTICSLGGPGHNPFFTSPPEDSPITISVEFMASAVGDLLEVGNNLTLRPPWPPPGYVIKCKDMIQALQFDVFILENARLMLCTAKNLWLPSPNRSPGLYCTVAEADLNLNIKQQWQVLRPLPWPSFKYHSERVYPHARCSEPKCYWQWERLQLCCPPNGVVCWKLCANGRPLSEEESSENSIVFLLRGKPKMQPWPPPSSIHGFLPGREENLWFQSWLELLLFGYDCSLEAFSDCHITGTCLKYLCPTLEAQSQELITTENLLGKIQLVRVTLLWQFLRKWKFNGSADYFVQSTCEAMQLQPTENLYLFSTSARHVDNHDKCILVLVELRHVIPASLYLLLYGFIAYTKIHPIVVFGRAVHLQFSWTIACGTVYWSFSYLQIIWLHPLLESGFQFCFAGKSLLSGYVDAQIPQVRLCYIWFPSSFVTPIIQYDSVVNQWKIAWSLNVQYFSGDNKFGQLSFATTLQGVLICRLVSVLLYPTVTVGCQSVTSSKISGWIMVEASIYCYSHYTTAFLDQACFSHNDYINNVQVHLHIPVSQPVDVSSSYVLVPGKEFHNLWDPGGYNLGLFDYSSEHILMSMAINKGICEQFLSKILWSIDLECYDVTQTNVHQTGQLIPATTLTFPHGMHLHFSLQRYLVISYLQIEMRSLNVNFIPLLDLPWDPGGLNRHRLEDKPNFMGRGLSATCSIPSSGWMGAASCWALGLSEVTTNTREHHNEQGDGRKGTDGLGRKARKG